MKRLLLIPLFVAVFLAAGCDTFDKRSREKAATFESLTPEQREKLKRGVIEIGDTQDMVYIALGRPDQTKESTRDGGVETIWIYNTYHREYEGNFHSGYRRLLIYDRVHKRYVVYYDPIYTDVYSEHEEEHIRIIFRDGQVAVIEQPKPRL